MLKVLLKESAGWLLRCCGMGAVLRAVLHRRRVAFLVYHDPCAKVFAEHMAWLARRYNFVSVDLVVDALQTGEWSAVPPRALVITFDDGHRGNAALKDLFPRFGVCPVIYLCSQIVNTYRHFWWMVAPGHAESLKTLDYATFCGRLNELAAYRPDKAYDERHAMNGDELTELSPHVIFGAHTRFHPILPHCSDVQAREEIGEARGELEALLEQPVRHFAYPNGDYGSREVALAKQAGYRSARTILPGWNGRGTDPFQLRALSVEDDASPNVLALRVSGVLIPFLALRRWLGRRPNTGAA